jgi:hypothetical protein
MLKRGGATAAAGTGGIGWSDLDRHMGGTACFLRQLWRLLWEFFLLSWHTVLLVFGFAFWRQAGSKDGPCFAKGLR